MPGDVIVHPFGEIQEELLMAVRQAIEQQFRMRVAIGESRRLPENSYSQERGQYRSTRFLDELFKVGPDPQIRLGVATVDLFVPELNFVFGVASSERRVAVFSIARLDPRFYGESADQKKITHRARRRSSARTQSRAWIGPLPATRLCHVVFKYAERNRSKRKCILQQMC